jgi:hypothetical protein
LSIVSHRITAIGIVALMVLLPLSLCCMTQQHPCCKARCSMRPAAAPVIATTPVITVEAPLPAGTHFTPDTPSQRDVTAATVHPRFNPTATIQLRI